MYSDCFSSFINIQLKKLNALKKINYVRNRGTVSQARWKFHLLPVLKMISLRKFEKKINYLII